MHLRDILPKLRTIIPSEKFNENIVCYERLAELELRMRGCKKCKSKLQPLNTYENGRAAVLEYGDLRPNIFTHTEFEFITAIYIPEHVQYIYLVFNRSYPLRIDCTESAVYTTLEEELKESKAVPTSVPLESILQQSKTAPDQDYPPKLQRSKRKSFITRDGVTYRRVVPVHPFIPICNMHWNIFYIELPEACTIYLEGYTKKCMSHYNRARCGRTVVYIDTKDVEVPLLTNHGIGPLGFYSPQGLSKEDMNKLRLRPLSNIIGDGW